MTPGMSSSRPFQLRAAGTLATSSPLSTACRVAFCTSTTGVSPATVIVSSRPPTLMSLLTVTVPDPLSSMPVRTTVLNPGSVKVSVYVPGRRSTMRYCPVLSVTTERTFSMSAGLAASTVTPGRIPPEGISDHSGERLCIRDGRQRRDRARRAGALSILVLACGPPWRHEV